MIETDFERVYESLPASGWLSKAEARLLWESSANIPGAILEVGCYKGRSTVLLASHGRKVYAVDPFEGFDSDDPTGTLIHGIWVLNIVERSLANVDLFKQPIETWDHRPLGFAYLDGDHTEQGTYIQIDVALSCGANVIAIHDVNDTGDGVKIRDIALKMLGPWDTRVERLAVWQRNV